MDITNPSIPKNLQMSLKKKKNNSNKDILIKGLPKKEKFEFIIYYYFFLNCIVSLILTSRFSCI